MCGSTLASPSSSVHMCCVNGMGSLLSTYLVNDFGTALCAYKTMAKDDTHHAIRNLFKVNKMIDGHFCLNYLKRFHFCSFHTNPH